MIEKIKNKIERFRTLWTIAPSSKFLVKKMVWKIDFENENLNILQLWFWTWVFTKEIVNQLWDSGKLTIFEIDEWYKNHIINDERIKYIEDSAEKISEYSEWRKYDIIVSTLPFASLPKKVSEKIFLEIKKNLKENGKFLQFQYTLVSKKDIKNLFWKDPEIDFELLNLPPAFIYETENNEK